MKRTHNRTLGLLAVAGVAVVLTTACTAGQPPVGAAPSPLPTGSQAVALNPADFSATIDNPYWPMKPGTRWTYRETDGAGAELTVVVTVTTETKRIANGIRARVVRDTVRQGDEVIEDTFDWYAQDADGTIWYLGEDTAEFENGAVVSTEGSFEAGVDGALAGIALPGDPQPGQQYRQEYYRGQAEDNGEVLSLTEMVDVPFGHFEDVLLTRDTITIEPDVSEHKFYAPGVGPVLTLGISGGSGREELISVEQVPDDSGTSPLGRPD